jgi:hypothetical protein
LESISNIFSGNQIALTADLEKGLPFCSNTVIPGVFDLSDFVLSYSLIDFGPDVDNMVRAMGDKITIKSQSFDSSTQPIAKGFSGQVELIYSQKMASVKSLFLHCSSNSVNGKFDAYEILNGGDLTYTIASRNYPQSRSLSSALAHRGNSSFGTEEGSGFSL